MPPTQKGLAAEPDALVVGVDFALSHRRLSAAANAVLRGAWFVATNRDPIYPTDKGLLAGAGAIVAAVAAAAAREPDLVVGKPEPTLFLEAAAVAGVPANQAVVIGDGLLTDIKAAHAVGARSVLMLTGVSTLHHLEKTDPACAQPRSPTTPPSSRRCSTSWRRSRSRLNGPPNVEGCWAGVSGWS